MALHFKPESILQAHIFSNTNGDITGAVFSTECICYQSRQFPILVRSTFDGVNGASICNVTFGVV